MVRLLSEQGGELLKDGDIRISGDVSQNHRTAQVGRNLKRSSGLTFHGKGQLDEFIWHPVQSHPEHPQWWGLYHLPGEVVPRVDCSHCKKSPSYMFWPFCPAWQLQTEDSFHPLLPTVAWPAEDRSPSHWTYFYKYLHNSLSTGACDCIKYETLCFKTRTKVSIWSLHF